MVWLHYFSQLNNINILDGVICAIANHSYRYYCPCKSEKCLILLVLFEVARYIHVLTAILRTVKRCFRPIRCEEISFIKTYKKLQECAIGRLLQLL